MADNNQNNQDHSTSSFKEQVLNSLKVDDNENSDSSENDNQNESTRELKKDSPITDAVDNPHITDEATVETVGLRSKPSNEKESNNEKRDLQMDSKGQSRKREDRIVSKIVLLIVGVLVIVIAIFGFTLYRYINAGLQPLDKNNEKLVQVYIPEGSSNKKIANILEEDKVIKSAMVFNYYAKFKNLTDFQAGYYQMAPNMTLDEVGLALREGGTAEPTQLADGKVTIPEGYDIEKIGDAIAENTDFKKDQFIELMKNQDFFNSMDKKYPDLLDSAAAAEGVRYRLEGYLFPATYDYHKDEKLEDFVEQMIAKTNTVIEPFIPTIHAKNMTVNQVLTLASLVEKEGVSDSDRKKIAQVFFNRIAANMPLQSDISILYALGEHKELVTYEDLEVDSPYNLYKNTGYGPGPLDSPSEQSINAVLNPEPNSYLYFVADIDTGKVYFAETYDEHNELIAKYVNKKDE